MILQIGRKRRNRLTGLTLIELIIVAAIILVLVAIASPLFRATFRDLELRDTAYNLSKLIKYGQQRAIIEERRFRLLFDFDKGAYHLLVKGDEEEELETALEGESVLKEKWENVEGRFGKYFYLPDGIKFKGEQDKITFLPNGRCDKITIYVVGQKNKTIEIRTNGRAGYVRVSEVNGR